MNTATENILDVTVLDPRQKHPTIFRKFDELKEGESMIIHNDHDPRPLYYQMISERGSVFKWQYLEEGPVWWKVKISRNISGSDDQTIGQLAAADLRKAEVFKKYGIDFCCGGKKTVREVCDEKGLDLVSVEKELSQAVNLPGQRPLAFNDWTPDFLVDYIVNTHHAYVKKTLPEITQYAGKVASVHGENHTELIRIKDLIEELHHELFDHLEKEEVILFPYVKGLVAAEKSGQNQVAPFGSVQNPILMMESEHDHAGRLLELIRSLSNGYVIPADACASYSLLFRMLEEFESDLHLHIHLENNILFPKAIELEKKQAK